ncbi:hypothetical protein [Pseudaestuariivita atlantica]|uniref:Uncharacterized protein n=1 Tax=Pseudaestuariivita atlantica TaxID=1317121 RepID=A0A0L1JMT4_9RHOB|nr:hypothetical protein [Pseudaestuariivita atlantica]KNG93059.1 hypothetical protein ATO11_14160 [Pseudaestuariivita atlantica]
MHVFDPVLTLRLSHGYFTRGGCPALTLAPSAETRATLARDGCRLWLKGDRLVLSQASEGAAAPVPPDRLYRFLLRAVDPHFATYTAETWAVPAGDAPPPSRSWVCASLADATWDADGAGRISASTARLLLVHGPAFRLPEPRGADDAPLAILRDWDDRVAWRQSAPRDNAPVDIALGEAGEGIYRIERAGDTLSRFCLSRDPAVGAFGCIDVFPAALPEGGAEVTLAFDARPTRWVYEIFTRTRPRSTDGWRIDGGSGPVAFTSLPPGDAPGAPTAVFRSDALIDLADDPRGRNDLRLVVPPDGARITDPLPLPAASPAATRLGPDGWESVMRVAL